MKARSTFARMPGLVAVAPLVAAAILLVLPGSTHDSSAPVPIPDAVEAAASPVVAANPGGNLTPEPAGVAGMVIGLDPETGAMGMPTIEQVRELSSMERVRLGHSQANLVPVFHTDGSISIDLQGGFQEFATVRIDPSGKKTFQCVDGEANAPVSPAAEER